MSIAFTKGMTQFRDRVEVVVCARAKEEMRRVHAATIVAMMADNIVTRINAVVQRVGNAVRECAASRVKPDDSVTMSLRASPFPASAGLAHAHGKTLLKRWARFLVLLQFPTPVRLVVVIPAQPPCEHGASA